MSAGPMMKIALPILLGVISARPAGAQLCPIESLVRDIDCLCCIAASRSCSRWCVKVAVRDVSVR